MEFGEKLRKAREAKGMTQQSLADQLYVTRQAVSRWECGARYPDLMMTKCISDILGVSVDELLSAGEAENFVMKQPVLESRRAEKVHFGLYLLLAMSSGFVLMHHLFDLRIALYGGERIEAISWFYLIREWVLYGTYFGLGLYGMWMLWKNDATPFASGLTGCVFFLVSGMDSIAKGIQTYLSMGYFPPISGWLGVVDFMIALAIFLYFRKENARRAKCVYGAGSLCLCWRVLLFGHTFIQMLHGSMTEILAYTYRSDMLKLMIALTAILTVFYQVRIMERKRKRFVL